jgi:hypothetical protein
MKLGIENRRMFILMLATMSVALLVFYKLVIADSSTPPAASAARAQSAAAKSKRRTHTVELESTLLNPLDPTLRLDLLKASETTPYAGSGRNIFKDMPDPPPQTATQVLHTSDMTHRPELPPAPPPIPLKYFGYESIPGQPMKVFLSKGDDVFIAHEGDIVDRQYKVLHGSATTVEIEDLLNKDLLNRNIQKIPLTQNTAPEPPH